MGCPEEGLPVGRQLFFVVEECPTMITMACSTAILHDTMLQLL